MTIDTKKLAIAAMSMFLALTFIDESGVAVTLPMMQRELLLSDNAVQWVMNSFFLTLAVMVLGAGRLADIVGHRRIFNLGLLLFAASSVAAAMAGSGELVIAARAVQGVGASCMLATYAVLLARVFPGNEQGAALGTSASIAAFFLAAGPFIGGALAEYVSWRAIFWINLPLSVAVWRAIVRAIPADGPAAASERFDFAGFVLFVTGFGALVLVLMQSQTLGWSHAYIRAGAVAALVLLSAFAWIELRLAQPLVDLRLFKDRDYLAANVVLLTAQISVMVIAFWAVWLQLSLGYSPLEAGVRLLPTGLPILFMGRWAGQWADRSGSGAPIRAGAILCLLSAVWMALVVPTNHYALSLVGMLLYGVGAPLVISPAIKAVLMAVPPSMAGMASGTLNSMRNLGAVLCFAVVGTVITWAQQPYLAGAFEAGGTPRDVYALLAAAADPQLSAMARESLKALAANAYAASLGWGMWAAALFALVGVLFSRIGLASSGSAQQAAKVVLN